LALRHTRHGSAPPLLRREGAFQRDLLGVYSYNEKQVLQLEEPSAEQVQLAASTGVRSIAEAYLHIAFANYGLTKAATARSLRPMPVGK